MTVGIWQPYFFPYIGYYQLLSACDLFVFYDDAQFIKRGFIHRNKIRSKSGDINFTIPLNKPSQNRRINETKVSDGKAKWEKTFLETLHHAYGGEQTFDEILNLVQKSLKFELISEIAEASVQLTAEYLGLNTRFARSSVLDYDRETTAEEKIIQIVKTVGGTEYRNPIGGAELYSESNFSAEGIELMFQELDKEAIERILPGEDSSYSMMHLLFTQPKEKIIEALACSKRKG